MTEQENPRESLSSEENDPSKPSDWKKTLSGALDENRLFCALAILFLFYAGYTINGAHQDINARDEDIIVHNCSCKSNHRYFYIAWSAICYCCWCVCHVLVMFLPRFKKKFIPWVRKFRIDNIKVCCSSVCKCECSCDEYNLTRNSTGCCNCDCYRKLKMCVADRKCSGLNRYEYYLWSQYYELYVVGIAKQHKSFDNIVDITEIIRKEFANEMNSESVHETSDNEIGGQQQQSLAENDHLQGTHTAAYYSTSSTALPKKHNGCGIMCCLQTMLHFLLAILRFCAQLAVVPLLLLQMFDTYAFLCFAADNYCSMRAQYKLHLVQTAVTFGFYLSLMISLLTTNMVNWVPLPSNIEDYFKKYIC